jgi:hypothetical protein
MKKTAIFLISSLFVILDGCEKSQSDLNSISSLKTELNNLANSKIVELVELDPCFSNNPYDSWGEALFIGMTKLSQTKSEFGNVLINDQSELIEKLKLAIPQQYLSFDTLNVNLKNVESLCDEFLSLYINRNIFESLQLSKKMENCVNQSNILKEVDKAYLLKFVSLVRYLTYFNYNLNHLSKKESFETCWKKSLQKIEDMGFFSRAACVIDWPMCLGAVAADCLVEQLRN